MKSIRAVLGAMLVWLLASVASAQAVAGSQLAGVIKDSSGGVLPGALVTIVKTDTAMTRTATTPSSRRRPVCMRISATSRQTFGFSRIHCTFCPTVWNA